MKLKGAIPQIVREMKEGSICKCPIPRPFPTNYCRNCGKIIMRKDL